MNIFGANPFEASLGSLRSANSGELGDQIILARLIQGPKLRRIGMGKMMEIKGVGNEAL